MTTERLAQSCLLSTVPTQQLHWLWQHYIPLGHLTLLEGPPGIGTSLLALHLAACITGGLPLPDGTACPKAGVVLLAPHDTRSDIIKPRIEAAGGDPNQLILLGSIPDPATRDPEAEPSQNRPFELAHDLPLLESFIHFIGASLVILDPITTALASTSLAQRLTILAQLADLAHRTGCAILLVRPIAHPTRTQLSSPGHLNTSAARDPIQTTVRSRLVLLPDPFDKETRLLHCPKHCLGPQPASLTCLIEATEQHLPIFLWLGQPYDPIAEQDAASYSRHRQDLVGTLRQSETALDALTLSRLCIQSYHALRKMLQRLVHQGQLVSPARGLFTTPGHPCLLHFPPNNPVPNTSPGESPTHNPLPTIAPLENEPPTSVAAQFIAPVGRDESTPPDPSTTSPSTIFTVADQPPNPPPSESHVSTSPPRPPQLDASDLYPSVMIRPRKEPEIYPGW